MDFFRLAVALRRSLSPPPPPPPPATPPNPIGGHGAFLQQVVSVLHPHFVIETAFFWAALCLAPVRLKEISREFIGR